MTASPRPDAQGSERPRTQDNAQDESALGKVYDARLMRRLLPYVLPHAKFVVISLATLVVITAVGLLRPLLMGQVVSAADARDPAQLMRAGATLSVLLVVTQSLAFVQVYAMQLGGARAMADLRRDIFAFLQRLSLRYYDRTPVGRLVTRATNDVDAVSELFASGVLNALGDLLGLVGIVVMMLRIDVKMALFAFAALPLVAMLVNAMRSRSRDAFREIRTKTARLNAFLNEQVSGIAVVQAFVREREMAAEFGRINAEYRDANKRSVFYEAVLDAAIEMVSTLCVASVLWWAGFQHLGNGGVTFAVLVTFTQYIRQFFEPVSMLAQRYTVMQSAMAGAERVFQLLDETDLDAREFSSGRVSSIVAADEAIGVDAVTFAYKPGTPVLRGVSFSARQGQRVALVGATGAGKTTVSSLLLRLYEVDSGALRVLGRDIRDWDVRALRQQFAVVQQDVHLFPGTVATNVAIGEGEPDLAKVSEALRRVGALELFAAREGGLLARVDERGANFSAGERQLIAFARAMYVDAPIIILDEATASVDSATEARLQHAVEAVMRERTAIVIAHRLATVRAADKIVVFHQGRVVEEGDHDSLVERDGVYARLVELQFDRAAEE
jgi:ATP-binding cassette subfamily B protein